MWPLLTPTVIAVSSSSRKNTKRTLTFARCLIFTGLKVAWRQRRRPTKYEQKLNTAWKILIAHVLCQYAGLNNADSSEQEVKKMTCRSPREAADVLLLSHHGVNAVQLNAFWHSTPWNTFTQPGWVRGNRTASSLKTQKTKKDLSSTQEQSMEI